MFLPKDKIRIFVSSTLGECRDERAEARRAIESLNHLPVMFEDAGARPHPPREMYLRALDDSQFFVGIYREKYGQLIPGMDISGVEDEYSHALTKGMDLLLYVKRNCSREERLSDLVGRMKPLFSLGAYDIPNDLYERIRDDVEALVSSYVFGGQKESALRPTSPGVLLARIAVHAKIVPRPDVEHRLIQALRAHQAVCVRGPLGSGKTVFLAALAEKKKWTFVQCGERTPREIIAEAANGVRSLVGRQLMRFASVEEALADLRATWETAPEIGLVLDDVRDAASITTLRDALSLSTEKWLITSSRDTGVSRFHDFELPPFDKAEIAAFISANRAGRAESRELEELTRLSLGNPLYLRYYAADEPGRFEPSIRDFELRAWSMLSIRSREAVGYVALAPRPLHLDHLLSLMAAEDDSPEEIASCLAEAANFVMETAQGYSIFHPHARETIRSEVSRSPQRLALYGRRLARFFEGQRDYSAAFLVLDHIQSPAALRLIDRAASHAATQGDVKTSILIVSRAVERARARDDQKQLRFRLIALAQMLSHAGQLSDALRALDEAETLPVDEDEIFPLAEVRLSVNAWAKGGVEVIEEFRRIKEAYLKAGRKWDAGRIALEISATAIRASRYPDGLADAKFALAAFEEEGDKYGVRLAKLNLLSLSSMVDGEEALASKLLSEFEAEEDIPPRQRAALCNVLSRNARQNNDPEAAKKYAQEAINIGIDLGDASVVCTNLIVLGNALRDGKHLEEALTKYEEADRRARDANFVQIEAHAQRLMASVFNQKGDAQRARHHAVYAIGLAKDGVSPRTEIEAHEELAESHERLSDHKSAIAAWMTSAKLAKAHGDLNEEIEKYLRAARLLYKHKLRAEYVSAYTALFLSEEIVLDDEASLLERLVNDFFVLADALSIESVFEAAAYHCRLLFTDLPDLLARQAYLELIERFSKERIDSEDASVKRLRAVLALSMSLPTVALKLYDVTRMSESVAHTIPGVSFRAHQDGAAHWAVQVPLAKSVIVTIGQLDDRVDVAVVALCIALVLRAYGPDLSETVLSGTPPTRQEAIIQVLNYTEASANLPLEKIGLGRMEHVCAVTRSTDPKKDAACPIVVITRDDLTKEWLLGSGRGNAGQVLIAEVLMELVFHLLEGDIELELLRPKLVRFVRQTII